MSTRVLLCDYPHRSIALLTQSHALIFRHNPTPNESLVNGSLTSIHPLPAGSSNEGTTAPRCMVEFADAAAVDLNDYRTLSPLPVHGTLGLITIANDIFLCLVTGASTVANIRPGETVQKIFRVEFYCLNNANYDYTSSDHTDLYASEGQEIYGQNVIHKEPVLEHPCLELQKLLSDGSFYFSTDCDLTHRLQDRHTEATSFDIDSLDDSFLWTQYMITPLGRFRARLGPHERVALDNSRILTSAIRGFVLTITIPPASAPLRTSRTRYPSSLTLISRLSCRRAGTRFNSRGIDDDGHVANFVESETIYWGPLGQSAVDASATETPAGICFSYVQIRGSVPVFWEQAAGLIPGQQKISVTRSKEGTQPAFDKHFGELEQSYGAVHVVNLLNETKPGELELTQLYRYGIRHSALNNSDHGTPRDQQLLRDTEFDFHAETKGPKGYEAASLIRRLIENSAEGFAYYLSVENDDQLYEDSQIQHRRAVVALQQEGVFRTNCLDCLDRTNLIQTIISQMAIESFLGHRGERAASDFWIRHSSLWADNGDALSKIYAGTGALKSSFTRHGKMSFAGAIADARKSATRLYINNFADKGRQNTIDVLLGRLVGQTAVHLFDPINDYVTAELNKRSSEFQSTSTINIYCGTFNLNGRTEGVDEDLSAWLTPDIQASQRRPDIVAVGFQEIVELSPQQIMNSDPTRKQTWENAVRKTLNKHASAEGSEHYVLLRSGQLVGAALCIFVKPSSLQQIKNVEGSVKKTGMSGMAGNKGAVAIRMDYANTQICFVTAHLAAGFANYEERNRDYNTIRHGLRFQRNRKIENHDSVIWMGDFNYRIGLGSEKVKQLIKAGGLETLYENDQLNLQMVAGLTFPHYSEARITFPPTYKYDLGEDTYDTSEKARIPAWTDRILRKGSNLRQINYNAAPLKFSDHRPIFATFDCTVSIVDEAAREVLSRGIYEKRHSEVKMLRVHNKSDDTDDEDLIGYDSIEPGLPPASSDQRKWWLDNGQPARSTLKPPRSGAIPNLDRPSNPYSTSDEPEWVNVPRVSRTSPRADFNTDVSRSITNGPRKLPPPFDPSSSAPSLHKSMSQVSLNKTPSRPTPLSTSEERRLSTSTNGSITKKPAPPIARKPVHLTASPSSQHSSLAMPIASRVTQRQSVEHTGFAPPPRRVVAANGRVDTEKNHSAPLPPQPQRLRKSAPDEDLRPSLPPRPVDLLGDAEDLNGWEALKPSV